MTTSRQAFLHRFAMQGPDDTSALEAAIEAGDVDPAAIVAILGKTEGNGCVNDFTRAFAVKSLEAAIGRHIGGDAVRRIAMVMSGGTEGALAPHMTVFEAREVAGAATGTPALALGRSRTPVLPAEDLGRPAQVESVAAGVRAAMADAGITRTSDVHYVQVKCPLLTMERIEAAEARGKRTRVRDTLKSMGLSRGASALGVAVALGELDPDILDEDKIGQDLSIYCGRAATSGGVELLDHEIMVAGMSQAWSGPLVIDHAVMADGLDVTPVRAALQRLGFPGEGQLGAGERKRVKAVLAKAEASQSGRVRGARHTMLDDSDISSTRHARAFVAGALAGVFGFTDLFVSGGAEHQGPDGGGPVAIVVTREAD